MVEPISDTEQVLEKRGMGKWSGEILNRLQQMVAE